MQLEILSEQIERKVIKSNALIEAKYTFSLMELRTFAYLVTLIKKGDDPDKRYVFEIAELSRILYEDGKRSGKIYDEVKVVLKKLRDKSFWISDGKQERLVSWVKDPVITENSGQVSFSFYPELRPHLFDLKARFTQYSLMYIARMKSKYSVRIYEALKQYELLGERKFGLDELREIVGLRVFDDKRKLIKDSMKRYPDFRRNVLDVATEEISNLSDLIVSYEDIRPKNKVTGIIFSIGRKTQEEEKEDALVNLLGEQQEPNKIEMAFIQRFEMGKEEAHELYEQAMGLLSEAARLAVQERNLSKDEYLWEKIQYCDWYTRICQKEVRNLVGFLYKAISNNYWTISFERHISGQKRLKAKVSTKEEIAALEGRKMALEEAYAKSSSSMLQVWVPANPDKASKVMEEVRKIGFVNRFYAPKKSLLENLMDSGMIQSLFLKNLYSEYGEEPAIKQLKETYPPQIKEVSLALEKLKG